MMVRIMWVVAVAVSLVACVEDAETGADASTSDLDAAVTDGATHDGTMGGAGRHACACPKHSSGHHSRRHPANGLLSSPFAGC